MSKKTVAVRPPAKTFRPKKIGEARQKLVDGEYDDPGRIVKMLNPRVIDKILRDVKGDKVA